MDILTDKVVSIIYELRKSNTDGEIIESLDSDRPLQFIFGRGNLLPAFEDNLKGLKSGDRFNFLLKSEDAYGSVQSNAIIDIPISVFEIDGKIDHNILQLGKTVPMMDREGRHLNGKICKIGLDNVTMDFNHPMAGIDLYFSGKVVDIRNPTEEELMHGHIHSGEGCGDCSSDGCNDKTSGGGCSCCS